MIRLALAATALSTALALAADWPVFRGDATQTAFVKEPLADKLVERWQFKVGKDASTASIESTAAIARGVAFIGAFDDFLYAIELSTGQLKWKYKLGAEKADSIKAPIAWHDGAVYAGTNEGFFHCVDAAAGKVRWKIEVGAGVTSGANFQGGDVLFGAEDETLHCRSRTDGKERWKFQISGGPVNGTPAIAAGKTFAAGCDSTLHVLDVMNGKELGAIDLKGQVAGSGAFKNGRLHLGTMSGEVLAIDLAKNDVAWTYQPAKRKPQFFSSAAIDDRFIVIGGRDRRVYAIELATGKEAWSFLTEGKVDSSPVIVGSKVYVGSGDGRLYVLEVATGAEIQRLQLDGAISASPAVADGWLVIGTEKGTIYGFGPAK